MQGGDKYPPFPRPPMFDLKLKAPFLNMEQKPGELEEVYVSPIEVGPNVAVYSDELLLSRILDRLSMKKTWILSDKKSSLIN